MGPEGYAGFAWLFEGFADHVLSGLILLEPIIAAVAMPAIWLTGSAMTVWLILVLVRTANVGIFQSLATGAVVALCIGWGFKVVTYQPEGRGAVKLLQIQETALTAVLTIYGIFSSSLSSTLAGHTVAGGIIPSSAAIEDAAARHANFYAGTDLARLIQDYNQQCAPSAALLGNISPGTRAQYQAVGLLGGAALGIPDEHYTSLGWIGEAQKNNKPESSGVAGTLFAAIFGFMQMDNQRSKGVNVRDIAKRRSRVAEGVAQLEQDAQPFAGGHYVLPTRAHWQSIFGDVDGPRDHLQVSAAPFQANSNVSNSDSTAFTPMSCAEAYRVANLGAQQAYHAMTSLGRPVGVPYTATENELLAGGIAWQRLHARALSGGSNNPSEAAKTGGAMMSLYQSRQDWMKHLELRALLPITVVASAYGVSLTIIVGPIFVIAGFIFGMKPITTWLSVLFFFIFFVIFAQIITVGASLALANLAVIQTGAALGWHGGGEEFDALRAVLGALAGVFLALAGWLATQLTGATVQGLAAAGRQSVTTAGDALSATAKLAGGVARVRHMSRGADKLQSAEKAKKMDAAREMSAAAQSARQQTAGGHWASEQRGSKGPAEKKSFNLNPPRLPSPPPS